MSENNFVVQWEEFTPRWFVEGIDKELSLKADYTDVYAGTIEYEPTTSPSFEKGKLYHEVGSQFICLLKSGPDHYSPSGSDVYHLPTKSDNMWNVYTLITYTQEYVQKLADTLIYKGVISQEADVAESYQRGWMYKIGTAGTYAGHVCEPGDVLIANSDGIRTIPLNNFHWDAIQAGDKSVTSSTTTSTNNRVSVYDGTTGKIIKQTAVTIEGTNQNALSVGRTGNVGNASIAYGSSVTASGNSSVATGSGTQATGAYSHAEGNSTIASNASAHAEGLTTTASGIAAHAEGGDTTASGQRSHAEGTGTSAEGIYSHAEGQETEAIGQSSHTEGYLAKANGDYSHAEGYQTSTGNIGTPAGHSAHAEGNRSQAKGDASHAEGYITIALGNNAHAEGNDTSASYANSHAEGFQTTASSNGAHAEGHSVVVEGQNTSQRTIASGWGSHAEGGGTLASGVYSHSENVLTTAYGESSHAEGYETTTGEVNTEKGKYAHAEGKQTISTGEASHAEGLSTAASGNYSHTEGQGSVASNTNAHAEGNYTTASGVTSHAEGSNTIASGPCSHAEGIQTQISSANLSGTFKTTASGSASHAEGVGTSASSDGAHSEGKVTTASGIASHAEGYYTQASGWYSHTEGEGTIANHLAQHVAGTYNIADTNSNNTGLKGDYVEIVGNGTSQTRSNARTLDWDGNERIMGDLYTGCNADSTGGTKLGDALALKAPLASPVLTGTPKSVTPTSSSNAKMIATKEYVDNAFTTFDAMLYKGVVNQNSDLPATHKQGWTYKVGTAGTYVGIVCEVGDMIVCNTDGTSANNSHWNVIQTNIDGAVIGPASSTTNHVALFNGATGKVIKDGGTIQSLIIDDNAFGVGASSKVWSAQKSIDELAKKVNEADLFAGIDIYDPNSASQGQFVFNANAYAHQIGTNYIVRNTDEGVYVVPPANLIDACLSYETLTFTEYIQRIADNTIDDTAGNGNTGKTWSADKIYDQLALKAPKASPKFTGSISLGRKADTTVGSGSMAIGGLVEATHDCSTALGIETKATGTGQFVFGRYNKEINIPDWVSGTHYYIGDNVLKEVQIPVPPGQPVRYKTARCECIVENSDAVFDETKWDIELNYVYESDYAEIVGNGEYGNPSNARALDWNGNEYLQGDLYFGCESDSTGGTKLGDALDLKANYTDVFAGCTEYVPVHRASFHTNAWYHEQGTAYICRLKSDDPELAIVLVGPTHSVPGGETVELPYHLPTVENSTFYVYSITAYIDSKAPKENPVFTGTLTLGSTTLTESKLQELVNLTSAAGVSF